MWKHDNVLPVSATRHVPVDNLDFVLKLRKDSSGSVDKPYVRPQSSSKKIRPDNSLEIQAILKEKPKETNCRNSRCLQVDREFQVELDDVSFSRRCFDSLKYPPLTCRKFR
jgi:hypothetical protein